MFPSGNTTRVMWVVWKKAKNPSRSSLALKLFLKIFGLNCSDSTTFYNEILEIFSVFWHAVIATLEFLLPKENMAQIVQHLRYPWIMPIHIHRYLGTKASVSSKCLRYIHVTIRERLRRIAAETSETPHNHVSPSTSPKFSSPSPVFFASPLMLVGFLFLRISERSYRSVNWSIIQWLGR